MALGFGFNKAKVLAQAEKFVQQGKLPNAIAEYEKIVKEDPKDVTVLNTIGDLNARVGNNDEAMYYFKKVGDMYAQNGFAVKAIAIYKKLTKIGPYNAEHTTKLAELYGQQGLFNDARTHYMQVADQLLKSGDNQQAARVFQKILELDPENAHTQAKLADLYQKLGKKDEARNIFYTAAESLYARGSYAAAEEALEKVLSLDPANTGALMLRGLIAVDAGDSQVAVQYLEKVTDLDARPDGLRALLRAKLHTGNAEGVEAVADKLLTKHNDVTGVTTLAQWYVTNNHVEAALRLYERYSEKLFAGNPAALQDALYPLTARVKDNPAALAIMNRLTNKAGDHAQNAEMMELQANTAAQKGSFAEARDLYQKLMEMEPENTLHGQNYKQMLAKLGEDSATRILSPEEAQQAFMVEELDETAPAVQQTYDPPTEKAIESALTDAELYVSYNVPAKAIPPLEAALPLAPQDVNLNQRLASLYVRAERFADAARMYQNLSKIYDELGHPVEAAKYLEAAKKYALRAPASAAVPVMPVAQVAPPPAKPTWPPAVPEAPKAVTPPPPVFAEPIAPPPVAAAPVEIAIDAEPSVQEFTFDTPELVSEPEPVAVAAPIEPAPAPSAMPELEIEFEPEPVKPVAIKQSPAKPEPPPVAAASAHEHEIDISNEWEDMIEVEPVESASPDPQLQTYHEMEHEPALHEVRLEPAAVSKAPADSSAQVEEKIQEIQFYITQEMWEPAKAAILDLTELAPDAPEVTELIATVSAGQAKSKLPTVTSAEAMPLMIEEEPAVSAAPIEIEPVVKEQVVKEPVRKETVKEPVAKEAVPSPPPVIEKKQPPAVASAPAMELEDVLDIPEPPKAQPPKAAPAPPVAAAKTPSTEDILSDFVLDLEETDLADFAPKETVKPTAPPVAASPVAAAPVMERRTNGDMQDAESANALSDILSELREETEEAAEPQEDPETHYNLGIAFKEMGLLDEAIGELQKVCHAVDRGTEFSQPIQAYTWLAQCLVDKGAPEAAVRWYQKSLHLPGLDDGSRCSIHYDLAMAFEASGDKKSALANFMEVYGSNIDFRDVASRIKALKS
ncbi:MAG TPA: tetratricopeptide repeat protein [Candidatus Angelobacter sp.]|jgi:tetratricopeptide (TPR) repeat protein